jgi:Domain of unknown function (DUF4411)
MPHQLRLRSKDEYAIDSSAVLTIPRLSNPDSAWRIITELAQQDRLKTVMEVMEEVRRWDEEVYARLLPLRPVLVYRDALTLIPECRRIVNKYPKMSSPRCNRNIADPWLIALAKTLGLAVVSNEHNNPEIGRKIPDVCRVEKLKHYSLEDFLRAEK